MDASFASLVNELHAKYLELMRMVPVTVATVPMGTPTGSVYLFSENGAHLYAGRTKRSIGRRIKDHVRPAPDCPFAWHLAREATGQTIVSYRPERSRRKLLADPSFKAAYDHARGCIRRMEIRYVGEPDPVKQALLEIYVAVVTKARHNDFDTH